MKTIILLLSLMINIIYSEKNSVEISFSNISELDQLVKSNIDLDHHRTQNHVHAFITDAEFNKISDMGFEIKHQL